MQNIVKMISRYTRIVVGSLIFLILMDFFILGLIAKPDSVEESPWNMTQEIADLIQLKDGNYSVPDEAADILQSHCIWAVLLDNRNLEILWHTDELPDFVPKEFTADRVASVQTGYIGNSPTFTGTSAYGLLITGYPEKSYWKLAHPSWEYHFIANAPGTMLCFFIANVLALAFIFVFSNRKILKSLSPLAKGIQALPTKEIVHVPEKGALSGLARDINHTSELLQMQKHRLEQKETARANWIAGVSHDIRTPLSMVMGYATQIAEDSSLPPTIHQKSTVIVQQSTKIRDLVNDLNLASKLEYNMQVLHIEKINFLALVRQVSVDFLNTDIEEHYPIRFQPENITKPCIIDGDAALLKRSVCNLIQNSINHNDGGCHIFITVNEQDNDCILSVEDDGIGISEEEMQKINEVPHYMLCDSNTTEQRHGLGLLIVRQVIVNHNGTFQIDHSSYGGFMAKITLPLSILP